MLHSDENLYAGINAHLHSVLQAQGGWDEFHTSHIVHLATLLKRQLRPMGYTARIEQSLQIRRMEDDKLMGKPESDVLISDTRRERVHQPIPAIQGQVIALPELVSVEDELTPHRAVSIRQGEDAVAWLELLSPSNKPGGQDAAYFRDKRYKLLQSGLVYVEIDYLHASAPTFERIPNYRNHEPDATPYRIMVIDPRPSIAAGKVYPHGFGVDETLPMVEIPLNAGDVLAFDFGAPYAKTFDELLYGDVIDYRQLPEQFERYSEADQARILSRMIALIEAHQNGANLRNVKPLALPLEAARARYEAL